MQTAFTGGPRVISTERAPCPLGKRYGEGRTATLEKKGQDIESPRFNHQKKTPKFIWIVPPWSQFILTMSLYVRPNRNFGETPFDHGTNAPCSSGPSPYPGVVRQNANISQTPNVEGYRRDTEAAAQHRDAYDKIHASRHRTGFSDARPEVCRNWRIGVRPFVARRLTIHGYHRRLWSEIERSLFNTGRIMPSRPTWQTVLLTFSTEDELQTPHNLHRTSTRPNATQDGEHNLEPEVQDAGYWGIRVILKRYHCYPGA
jgi:hypothetical protein